MQSNSDAGRHGQRCYVPLLLQFSHVVNLRMLCRRCHAPHLSCGVPTTVHLGCAGNEQPHLLGAPGMKLSNTNANHGLPSPGSVTRSAASRLDRMQRPMWRCIGDGRIPESTASGMVALEISTPMPSPSGSIFRRFRGFVLGTP